MNRSRPLLAIALVALASLSLVSCRTTARSPAVVELLKMSEADLDKLFSASEPGPIPSGPAEGTAIVAAGSGQSPEIANLITEYAWKGKVFDPDKGTLINRVGLLGTEAIVADVYIGRSLVDGKDCIVLDYSKTSTIARHIRDEIRMIGPNTYLGPVYWDGKKLFYFALQFKG